MAWCCLWTADFLADVLLLLLLLLLTLWRWVLLLLRGLLLHRSCCRMRCLLLRLHWLLLLAEGRHRLKQLLLLQLLQVLRLLHVCNGACITSLLHVRHHHAR
jgi:hypothetical protein